MIIRLMISKIRRSSGLASDGVGIGSMMCL